MELKLAKIVTMLVPIAIHASGLSVVELLSDQLQKSQSESMLPDVASLMFVTATSMIVTEWLQNNPIRLTGTNEMKSFVVAMIGVSKKQRTFHFPMGNKTEIMLYDDCRFSRTLLYVTCRCGWSGYRFSIFCDI